jgi:hypothetical protein
MDSHYHHLPMESCHRSSSIRSSINGIHHPLEQEVPAKLRDGIPIATMEQIMVPMRRVVRVDLIGGNPRLGIEEAQHTYYNLFVEGRLWGRS